MPMKMQFMARGKKTVKREGMFYSPYVEEKEE